MLENYLLEELVTFARAKTLAKTAQALNVTQPTVTRGMQKLEEELNVQLFDRAPNRISLTKTGMLAAREAAQLLNQQQAFVTKVQNYAHSLEHLRVETTLPGPLVLLTHLRSTLPANLSVDRHIITNDQIIAHLTDRTAKLIFSNREIQTPVVESRFIGNENLIVHLQKFMYQANQPSITFKELRGLSFVVLNAIGSWRAIIQQAIPDAKFLYQPQRSAFTEITRYSDFPYFSTNLSPLDPSLTELAATADNRVAIPITDTSAHMPIYLNYLTTERTTLKPLLDQLTAAWPR